MFHCSIVGERGNYRVVRRVEECLGGKQGVAQRAN